MFYFSSAQLPVSKTDSLFYFTSPLGFHPSSFLLTALCCLIPILVLILSLLVLVPTSTSSSWGLRSRRSSMGGGGDIVGPRIYSCCNCRCHIADHDDVISKAFQGRNGRAYLFANVVNVNVGPREDRQLMTGLHTVADISCFQCQELLGWKYEKAYEEAQKYKEGKFILEKAKVMKEDW